MAAGQVLADAERKPIIAAIERYAIVSAKLKTRHAKPPTVEAQRKLSDNAQVVRLARIAR